MTDVIEGLRLKEEKPCCKQPNLELIFSHNKGDDEKLLEDINIFAPETAKNLKMMFEKTAKAAKKVGLKKGIQQGRQKGMRQILDLVRKNPNDKVKQLILEVVKDSAV